MQPLKLYDRMCGIYNSAVERDALTSNSVWVMSRRTLRDLHDELHPVRMNEDPGMDHFSREICLLGVEVFFNDFLARGEIKMDERP